MRRLLWLGLGVVAGMLFWVWIGGSLPFREANLPEGLLPVSERRPVPELTFRDLEGKTVSIRDGKGEPLLLIFWASW